jgi:alkanesulfonate monooxygenase SsuD/methylene tetrahydromethanopterin reductase-like flavin-dependent oxidoreductase (luciferase family)
MEIGIGLPNAVAGTSGRALVEFAREAERLEFTTLGTIDRLVYDSYEPLTALAAAGAVTERIRLMTSILLTPLRTNTALLAKQAASVNALSEGRLDLGLAVGAREDDYEASGVSLHERGRRFDEQLRELKRVFERDSASATGAGPARYATPRIILGGYVEASFRRAAEFGDGWIMGGGPPEAFAQAVEQLRRAWNDAGREGDPRTMALAYFALGPTAEEDARSDLLHYYAFLGEYAERIVEAAAKDPDAVRATVGACEEVGCDELLLLSCSSDPDQARLLREALQG